MPKTSSSSHGPPRPTPSRNLPSDTWWRFPACSANATGCWADSTLTAVPTVIREVRPSATAASVTADGQTPYDMKWCSAIQASSNPARSAASIASTVPRSTSPGAMPGKPAATRKTPILMLAGAPPTGGRR
ncbi:UNVERIFIED_ORG: hypothetical protein FHR35_005254 [Microbispora rosea subsp. rosea]